MIKKLIISLLPKFFKRRIIDIKNKYFDGYAFKSYSLDGEDIIINRLFGKQQTGFYVDVGACHPKRFSNTYYFYKKGWRGINIDAMPDSMKLFNKLRQKDINIEKPISDRRKILKYYAFNEPALNGFSKELSEQRNGHGGYYIKFTKDIQTVTLEEILDNHLPHNQEIDFLSIDVEGIDFMVLKSNNFEKYKPKVILIEMLGSTFNDVGSNKISIYLNQFNYSIYTILCNTVIFVEDKFIKNSIGV